MNRPRRQSASHCEQLLLLSIHQYLPPPLILLTATMYEQNIFYLDELEKQTFLLLSMGFEPLTLRVRGGQLDQNFCVSSSSWYSKLFCAIISYMEKRIMIRYLLWRSICRVLNLSLWWSIENTGDRSKVLGVYSMKTELSERLLQDTLT